MLKKQKKRNWFKVVFFVLLMGLLGGAVFRYTEALEQYWRLGMAILDRDNVKQQALALRHEPIGLYCVAAASDAAEECFVFDEEGVLFDRARTIVGDVIVKIKEETDQHFALRMPLMPPEDWQNIYPIIEAVRAQKFPAQNITLRRADKELTAYMGPQGIPFYFSYTFNPRAHLEALPAFFKQVPLTVLQYADLRVENKIFYK